MTTQLEPTIPKTGDDLVMMAVHIGLGMQPPPACQLSTPANNWAGSLLLRRMLQLALGELLAADPGSEGELNDCLIVFIVAPHNQERAAEIIRHELTKSIPLVFQIGIRRDGQWSCLYPDAGLHLEWLFDSDRMDAAHQDMEATSTRLWREAMRSMVPACAVAEDSHNPS